MQWIIAGLGNPGEEYQGTRHNVGRDFVLALAEKEGADTWKTDKTLRAQVAKGEVFGKKATLVLPDMYMNNSGASLKALVTSAKQAEHLAVMQDELDLPLGVVKLSFGSGSGGHKGIESLQKVLKTRDFVRVRVGISPSTSSGKLKKPDAKKIVDFVLGKFKSGEAEKIKKARKLAFEALELLLTEGREKATMVIHSK